MKKNGKGLCGGWFAAPLSGGSLKSDALDLRRGTPCRKKSSLLSPVLLVLYASAACVVQETLPDKPCSNGLAQSLACSENIRGGMQLD